MASNKSEACGVDWVVIYDDLSTFDSNDGSFADAPAWGIQVIAYLSKQTGWSTCESGDYYIQLPNGEFLALDNAGFIDYSANIFKNVKVGRMISRTEFGQAYAIAKSILMETKTAHFRNERKV